MSTDLTEHIEIESTADSWNPVAGPEVQFLLQGLPLNQETSQTLQSEAFSVLSRCVSPLTSQGDSTGLVIGYVQSGKTMSFTTVAALARDNGFAVVIVIAGTSVPLTNQSHRRLRGDLRLDARIDRAWRHLHNPRVEQQAHAHMSTTLADWRDPDVPAGERQTVLITVMKNYQHLDHLIDVLQRVDLANLGVLIIDDEADQAGLNNLINDGDESTTYQRLRTLKSIIPSHTFLQYTATPQGPLLINLIDVLSPGFAVPLTPGPAYTGGREFFVGQQQLVRIIPPADIPSTRNILQSPPDSLLDALRLFFLGVASGIIRDQGRGNRSMMVHPTQKTGGHQQFFAWVSQVRDAWLQVLEAPETDPDRAEFILDFRRAHDDLATTVEDLEPFDQLFARLRQAIRRTDIHLVNASQGQTPQIDWRGSYAQLLVGGQALDRGYTVEGLTVTYMPRGVGARRADTIQQRARFFGYKRPYLGYCRVYLEQQVADAFARYVQHEEDIRAQIVRMNAEGRSLDDLRRAFLLPQGLFATRDSIIDIDYLRTRFSEGWFYPRAPHNSPSRGELNRQIVAEFIETIDLIESEGHPDRSPHQRHLIASGVSLASAYEHLLLPLRFSHLSDAQNLLGVLVILRNHLRQNPEATCSIVQMSPSIPRERTLNDHGMIPNLFQGAAPVNPPERRGEVYPGDREIHADAEVTLQLHSLNLTEQKGTGAYFDVPTIAIWLPPDLAGDVLIQDQGGDDEPHA